MNDNVIQLAEHADTARLRRIVASLDEQERMFREMLERVHALREATVAKLQSTNATTDTTARSSEE